MYRTLSDLRILKLVLAVEDAFKAYDEALLECIEDPAVRDTLKDLLENGALHDRLEHEHDRLHAQVFNGPGTPAQADVLQVVLECERSARDLYLRYLDRLKDPQLVELLRKLAKEEEDHAWFVQQVRQESERSVSS